MLDYHGREGYLSVSDGSATPLNKEVYARAMEELGYPSIDCNGKSQIGKCYDGECIQTIKFAKTSSRDGLSCVLVCWSASFILPYKSIKPTNIQIIQITLNSRKTTYSCKEIYTTIFL